MHARDYLRKWLFSKPQLKECWNAQRLTIVVLKRQKHNFPQLLKCIPQLAFVCVFSCVAIIKSETLKWVSITETNIKLVNLLQPRPSHQRTNFKVLFTLPSRSLATKSSSSTIWTFRAGHLKLRGFSVKISFSAWSTPIGNYVRNIFHFKIRSRLRSLADLFVACKFSGMRLQMTSCC